MAIWTYQQIYDAAVGVGFTPARAQTISAIALAESGGNTGAVSSPNTNGTVDYGLVQINSIHFGNGITQAQALSPFSSLNYALKLSNGGTNFQPWTTFNTGAYEKYLQGASPSPAGGSVNTPVASTTTGLAGVGTFLSNTGGTLLLFTIAITLLAVGFYFLAK